MITIDPSTGRATALVVADIPAGASDQILAMATPALDLLARQPGFVSATLYVSKERDRLITHLQWEHEEDPRNCLKCPDFAAVPPPPPGAPLPRFVAQLYDTVATRAGEPGAVSER